VYTKDRAPNETGGTHGRSFRRSRLYRDMKTCKKLSLNSQTRRDSISIKNIIIFFYCCAGWRYTVAFTKVLTMY
jgi:hypothetical protein